MVPQQRAAAGGILQVRGLDAPTRWCHDEVVRRPRRSPRQRDDFLRPYRVGATVLLVLGVLCLLVELQSASLVFWTGERVPGTNDGGIIYYTVDGQNRTLNDPREAPARPEPVVVYADPEDSSRDRSSSLARGFDAVFVFSPFVAAAGVITVGLVRRRGFRRRVAAAGPLPPLRPGSAGEPHPSRSSRWPRSSR